VRIRPRWRDTDETLEATLSLAALTVKQKTAPKRHQPTGHGRGKAKGSGRDGDEGRGEAAEEDKDCAQQCTERPGYQADRERGDGEASEITKEVA